MLAGASVGILGTSSSVVGSLSPGVSGGDRSARLAELLAEPVHLFSVSCCGVGSQAIAFVQLPSMKRHSGVKSVLGGGGLLSRCGPPNGNY